MKKKRLAGIFCIMSITLCGISVVYGISTYKSNIRCTMTASRDAYSLDESISKADVIAEVRIAGVATETDINGIPQTIHDAEIIETYKGNLTGQIHILQDGVAEIPMDDNPIFSKGEEYLLIMKCGTSNYGYNDVYWVLKEYFVSGNQVIETLPGSEEDYETQRISSYSLNSKSVNDKIIKKAKQLPYNAEIFEKEQLVEHVRKEI